MSAFQTVVWLYNWEALSVFDLFIFFKEGSGREVWLEGSSSSYKEQ